MWILPGMEPHFTIAVMPDGEVRLTVGPDFQDDDMNEASEAVAAVLSIVAS